jgi:import inner membrane translocase subunit TIM22
MMGMSKSFAFFGCFFSVFECQLERLRHKDDMWNSFFSAGMTSIIVSAEALGPRGLVLSGLGGGMFGLVMYKV